MSELSVFRPPRRNGLLFHAAAVIFLGSASVLVFLLGINQPAGGFSVLLMLLALLLFSPLPWLVYRAIALASATYRMERDGLRLRWGLRAEDIPLPDIEWVRRPTDLAATLPLPQLRWPGAILGAVQVADLGTVEYLASTTENLLLIATPRRVYIISPENPNVFLRSFQQTLEMGSLTPISPASVLPAAYLTQVWANLLARWLLSAGFILNLLLFVIVGLIIPGGVAASLGFYPNGAPLPNVPAAQLILLPILGSFIFAVDVAVGLFFFRREEYRMIAYITWISAVLTSFLLAIGVIVLLLTVR